jgi:hypothetical protein
VWARNVQLVDGFEYNFTLNVPADADYDLYLYKNTGTTYGEPAIAAKSTTETTGGTEKISLQAPSNGTYYIVIKRATETTGEGNFTLTSSEWAPATLQLQAGWNMVSFQVTPDNTSFSSIFNGVGYYQVVTWNGASYVTPTDAEAGRGYWALVLTPVQLNLTGITVINYELDLPAGWSMIGGLHGKAVNANDVFPSYYQLVTWSGTSYATATTIEPGKGYWALVLVPTHITVDK